MFRQCQDVLPWRAKSLSGLLCLATTWALRRGMHNFHLSSFFDSSARLALDAFADVMFLALLNWSLHVARC